MSNKTRHSLKEYFYLIHESWIAHNRDSSRAGFRAVLVYYFGNWRMGIKNKFIRAPFSFIYRFFYRYVRNNYGIELPYTVMLGARVIFEHQHGIVIHGRVIIGDDSIIRQGVTIGNRYVGAPNEAPVIGARVNIGAGAVILGNITVGDNAFVGANSVVLHDVMPETSVAGIPAKLIESDK